MNVRDVVWNAIGTLVAVVTAIAPVYVAYDLWGRGTTPEKIVELKKFDAINPLADMSPLGERSHLTLQVEDRKIDNLLIAQAMLQNTGKSPILPSDYVQPLTVAVKSPWKIVAVVSSATSSAYVQMRWKRVDETRFEAEPALLNPSDLTWTYVYLTNSDPSKLGSLTGATKPEVDWTARIVNLRSFREPEGPFERAERLRWGLHVELSGWASIFTLVATPLFLALYLRLLSRAGLVRDWGTRAVLLVVGASLLSLAAAESIATYAFGNVLTSLTGVDHWLNAPPIAVHVVVLVYLVLRTRASGRRHGVRRQGDA